MEFTIKQKTDWASFKSDCLIVALSDSKTLSPSLKTIDKSLNGLISQLVKQGDIKTTKTAVTFINFTNDKNIPRLMIVGANKKSSLLDFRNAIQAVASHLNKSVVKNATLAFDTFLDVSAEKNAEQLLQQCSQLMTLSQYRYDQTLSKKAAKISFNKLTIAIEKSSSTLKSALKEGAAMASGANVARHLGNLPGNICTPSFLASEAQKLAKSQTKLTTKILSEAQMKKLKMGSLLSVTEGTSEPAKFIIMEYKGGKATDKPTVLVGKGVTFDSGGISLKPGAKMDEMKYDMCGAASVFGTMNAVTQLQIKANIIGVVAAVENMPAGNATKPGDVVTSMSGKTIEILNTDAEGRLVLCDALTYVERFKPKAVIDIATLTGACVVALGSHASGLYSNDEKLSEQLNAAGIHTYDRAWPMPLWDEYNQQLQSNFADIGNIGGPGGGSVTAACFLSRFAEKYKWAHLDIAGAAWIGGTSKGATGRPVSLLTQYLLDNA